jgi:integrase
VENVKRRGHGEGSIYWRSDRNCYEAVLDLGKVDGKRQRKVVYAKTKKEVLAKLATLEREIQAGTITSGPDQTVGEWLNTWHTGLEATGKLKDSTIRNYRNVIDFYITPHVGKMKLVVLTAEDVDRMTANLAKAGKSTNTQRLARTVLRRAIGQAERRGYVSRNVVSLTDGVAVKVNENVPLTPDQAKQVLTHVTEDSSQWAALYTLALHQGLREGELIGLRWRDTDLDGGTVRVTGTYDPIGRKRTDPKSESSKRTITLTPEAVERLREHRDEQSHGGRQGSDGLVFTSRQGTALFATTIRRHWRQTLDALDLPQIRFHDLRHSCATILLDAGESLERVSKLLGHSSIRITADVYAYVSPEATKSSADIMSKALR